MALHCLDHLLYVAPLDEDCTSMSDTCLQAKHVGGSSQKACASHASALGLDRKVLCTALSQPLPWKALECPTTQQMCTFMREALRTAVLEVLACGALDAKQAKAIGQAATTKLQAAANAVAPKHAADTTGRRAPDSRDVHCSEHFDEQVSGPAPSAHQCSAQEHQELTAPAASGSDAARGAAARCRPQKQHKKTSQGAGRSSVTAGHGGRDAAGRTKRLRLARTWPALRSSPPPVPGLPAPVAAVPTGPMHVCRHEMAGAALNGALLYYQMHRVRHKR